MKFEKTLSKYQKIVNKRLNRFLQKKISDVKDPFLKTSYNFLRDYILRGGKRLRPIATIMIYRAVKRGDKEKIYLPALSTELFHCSLLIHDDIMDEDSLRRNKPSMHKLFESYFLKNYDEFHYKGPIFNKESQRFSVSMAIIQGNILYSLAESCLIESNFSQDKKAKALEITNKAYRIVNHGQVEDILMPVKKNLSEKDYMYMATNKTAKLISAAIELGALLGNANLQQRKALKDYGMQAALAFQIQDDIIDITDSMKKGRILGSDIRKGKRTLLMINALNKANKKQKQFLLRILSNEETTKDDIKKSIQILNETKSIDYAKKIALGKIKKAKSYLKQAGLTKEGSNFFNDFADFMISREI